MTTQQFIERAIEGGWKHYGEYTPNYRNLKVEDVEGHLLLLPTFLPAVCLLDPEAWKAVGKVEGWHENTTVQCTDHWLKNMHRMIDALAEGKTIDEFFETL